MGIVARITFLFVFSSLLITTAYAFNVCTESNIQATPAISGTTVVWQDFRTGSLKPNIYCRHLNEQGDFRLCASDNIQETPDIDGNVVVWAENGNIIGYDLANSVRLEICVDTIAKTTPAISGNLVVWAENGDIYGKYLGSGSKFPICTASGTQSEPDVDGDIVVWRDLRNENDDIYGKNLTTGQSIEICINLYNQAKPRISGQLVVWQDYRNDATTQKTDIYGRYLNQTNDFAICTAYEKQSTPDVSGTVVVWVDKRTGFNNIYHSDLSKDWNGTEYISYSITSGSSNIVNPRLSNYSAIWENKSAGSGDIYGAFLTCLTSLSITNPQAEQFISTGEPISIQWQAQPGLIGVVNLEISLDAGLTYGIIAANILNTGSYEWTPEVSNNSENCRIRLSAAADSSVNGISGVFAVAQCSDKLTADLDGNCIVNMADFAAFSAQWIDCGNPYDDSCIK